MMKPNDERVYMKDLQPGMEFTTPDTHGTVYRAVAVRPGKGRTSVTYTVPGTDMGAWVMHPSSLTVATLV